MSEDIASKAINKKLIGLFVSFECVGFLVYIISGYNYFMSSEEHLFVKIVVPIILFFLTLILYRKSDLIYAKIFFCFSVVSLGFLMAWFLGGWYNWIPGLVSESVQGWSVAKIAEVLPIVLTVIISTLIIKDDFEELYFKGGFFWKSIKLGLYATPLAIIQFFVMGGLAVNVDAETILGWIPWLILFAFSNSIMEELIFRGLFFKKYEPVFSKKTSLILISIVFAIMHAALLPYLGILETIMFVSFLFFLGMTWGYIIQKSQSIWGAVLAHTIADILFVIAAFGIP